MAGAGDDDDHQCCPWQDDVCVEHHVWVPVRAHKLSYLSSNLGDVMQTRWWHRLLEHEWESAAAAAEAENPADADRSLDMARRLLFIMSEAESSFVSMLGTIQRDLETTLHPRRRRGPCPGSAVWWRWCGGNRWMRFVHLSREEVARVDALIADALSRARRLRAPEDDLRLFCWGPLAVAAGAAGLHATPLLVARLRHAQRLADAVLVPLHELRRFVDHVIADDNKPRARGGRGRSVSPSRRPDDDVVRSPPKPVLSRTASMHLINEFRLNYGV